MCQGGVIWGGEGVELLGVYLGRTVAPVQFVLEIKAYFLYNGLPVGIAQCSQFYGRYKVFFCVGTQVSYGQLSVKGLAIGCWEPVSTMGLGLPWIRYESAAAV